MKFQPLYFSDTKWLSNSNFTLNKYLTIEKTCRLPKIMCMNLWYIATLWKMSI